MSESTDQINRRAFGSSKKKISFAEDVNFEESDKFSRRGEDFSENNQDREGPKQHSSSSNTKSWLPVVWRSMLCVACGMVFGIAMHKGSVTDPDVIRKQMTMQQFIMIKFFLSALATSMLTMSILAMLPFTHHSFMLACNEYFNKLAEKSILSSIVGGGLMGVGMTLAGSHVFYIYLNASFSVPRQYSLSSALVFQMWMMNSEYFFVGFTFLGALSGVLIYCLTKPVLDSMFKPTIKESCNPWSHSPYFTLALPLVAMFGITVCAFETLIPWDSELKVLINKKKSGGSFPTEYPWPPYVCGIIVGMLQVPLILGLHRTLSGSSSQIVLVSQIFVGPLRKLSSFACKYQRGFDHWWQVFYVGGAVLGGYISASTSNMLSTAHGVTPIYAFTGGLLMNIGARIGGGCTSNHGLTGMGLLSILSFIMIGSTFGGAISTAIIMKMFGFM